MPLNCVTASEELPNLHYGPFPASEMLGGSKTFSATAFLPRKLEADTLRIRIRNTNPFC